MNNTLAEFNLTAMTSLYDQIGADRDDNNGTGLLNLTDGSPAGAMGTNSTRVGDPSKWNTDGISVDTISIINTIFPSVRVLVCVVGTLLNILVFQALQRVHCKGLKSKIFIQNAIIVDIVMASGQVFLLAGKIIEAFGASFESYKAMQRGFRHIHATALYLQAFGNLLLASDRMYAVVRPMTYHTAGYNTLSKILLIGACWLAAISLMLPGILIPFLDANFAKYQLHEKLHLGFEDFTNILLPFVSIGLNSLIFLLYVLIFISFVVQKRMNRAVAGSSKASASLTMTYFLIHTSTLCLYLPGPIMKILTGEMLRRGSAQSRLTLTIVTKLLVILYLCNTVINPMILVSRVRLIRENLYIMLKMNRAQSKQVGKMSAARM